MAELVGTAEIATMMGLSRQRVNELVRSDPDFPVPQAELAAGRIWDRRHVEAWMAHRARPKKGVTVSEINGVTMVEPSTFSDVQVLADTYLEDKPVILGLRGLDLMQRRRCIDFSSGIAYALGGNMSKLADHVYLLEPQDATISAKQRKAIADQL